MVRNILGRQVLPGDWTVQGFGMLRAYFDKDKRFRLNIWDKALAVPDVSLVHDHPWSFNSWIINGALYNQRFLEQPFIDQEAGTKFDYMTIKTGEGGGPEGEVHTTRLLLEPTEVYKTGDSYHQEPTEIHFSGYLDGTVTLNDRIRFGDGEHARVFWPHGQSWVDAMPRKATEMEVLTTISKALKAW